LWMDTNKGDVMVRTLPLGLDEALKMMFEHIEPLPAQSVQLVDSVDRVAAADLFAQVDSPSVDASLKDGYAVMSGEVCNATADRPVRLKLSGHMAAGSNQPLCIGPGLTVRVLTGAAIPAGADAVVSEEFTVSDGSDILVQTFAEPGRNILPKGSDVSVGKCIVRRGQRLTPGMVGMLAAAGHSDVPVISSPTVAVIATGDEVVAPGQALAEGKLYASNMTTLAAWCRRYRLQTRMAVVRDDPDAIRETLKTFGSQVDAIITSGGAWTGDHDMVAHILGQLGWRQVFHRIRIGPGKAVGFGTLNAKPVFILPGGPPSNLMGFLQIALPGLMALSGHARPGLPTAKVRLASELRGRYADWTQFVFGALEEQDGLPVFHSLRNSSRLRSMAEAAAVAAVVEGRTLIPEGSVIAVQVLT
jgi:molybdopterin molybdotransferase